MLISGEYTFSAPREVVWDLLQDPDVLAKALPGARELVRTGENQYRGKMRVGVGPVTAAEWTVEINLRDLVPPDSYSMQIDSKGPLGFTRGGAQVSLVETAETATAMRYTADLQVGGKVAGVGQRLLDQVAKVMTKQGLDALNRELERRLHDGVSSPADS